MHTLLGSRNTYVWPPAVFLFCVLHKLLVHCHLVFSCTHTPLILDHPWHLVTNCSLFCLCVSVWPQERWQGVWSKGIVWVPLPPPPSPTPVPREKAVVCIKNFSLWNKSLLASRDETRQVQRPPASTLLPEVDSGNQEMTLTSK